MNGTQTVKEMELFREKNNLRSSIILDSFSLILNSPTIPKQAAHLALHSCSRNT